MTWAEWVESDYNDEGVFENYDGTICDGYYVVYLNSYPDVVPSDVIIADGQYKTYDTE